MLEWLIKYKPYFETLSFLANLGLVTSLIIGIRQLKLVKQDMRDRNKRAAVEKSIEYLNWFATDMIPKIGEYNKLLRENKVPIYGGEMNDRFMFDEKVSLKNKLVQEQLEKTGKLGVIHILNQLEFFSAAMMSGLADEELAFNPLAKTFCGIMEKNYVVLCYTRQNDSFDLYSNAIKLYNMWKARIRKHELEKSRRKIDDDMSKINDTSVKTIGM